MCGEGGGVCGEVVCMYVCVCVLCVCMSVCVVCVHLLCVRPVTNVYWFATEHSKTSK